ncbi:transcriptional regulator (plasmid) [Paracoccus yeei]
MSQETRLRAVRLLQDRRAWPCGAIGKSAARPPRGSRPPDPSRTCRIDPVRREGRIIYGAVYSALAGLVGFLSDCCQGHPEICAPAVAALSCACDTSLTESA